MIIGLTGGIGTGKSTVAKVFEVLGAVVFDSDTSAKHMYFMPEVKAQVIDLLGKEAYASDTQLNKIYISHTIFSNTDLLKQLNQIIHPAVGKAFKAFAEKNQEKLVVKESALLFETGIYKELPVNVVVTSPLEMRIDRVMKRDGLSRHEVEQKIKSQMSDEEKIKLADHVIYNNEKDSLIEQVITLYHKLHDT